MQQVGIGLEIVDHLLLLLLDLLTIGLNLGGGLLELLVSLVLRGQIVLEVVELTLQVADLPLEVGLLLHVGVDLGLQLILLLLDAGHHVAELIVHDHLVHFGLFGRRVKVHEAVQLRVVGAESLQVDG